MFSIAVNLQSCGSKKIQVAVRWRGTTHPKAERAAQEHKSGYESPCGRHLNVPCGIVVESIVQLLLEGGHGEESEPRRWALYTVPPSHKGH
jgi:hypothetical protein